MKIKGFLMLVMTMVCVGSCVWGPFGVGTYQSDVVERRTIGRFVEC